MKKLDILRLFEDKESLTPSHLANLLDIKPNYARQIILRLKRQGLIFLYPSFAGTQAYSLTTKGEERIIYLADKEKREREAKAAIAEKERKEAIDEKHEKEAIQEKPRPMFLHRVISHLPKQIKERIRREFGIASVWQLANKKLSEIALPQQIWEETGFSKLSDERILAYRQLPFNVWIRVLENISKPRPKPQHLSLEEVLIITALTKRKKGEFLVTKDSEMLHAPGEGYLTVEAATVLAAYRKAKRTR